MRPVVLVLRRTRYGSISTTVVIVWYILHFGALKLPNFLSYKPARGAPSEGNCRRAGYRNFSSGENINFADVETKVLSLYYAFFRSWPTFPC
jgi:hypothetical protein